MYAFTLHISDGQPFDKLVSDVLVSNLCWGTDDPVSGFSSFSSDPLKQIPGYYLKLDQDLSLPHIFQIII
jgi:hypothetical protein